MTIGGDGDSLGRMGHMVDWQEYVAKNKLQTVLLIAGTFLLLGGVSYFLRDTGRQSSIEIISGGEASSSMIEEVIVDVGGAVE
ncbi:MAG: hypothetical protein ACE5ER_01005, partial [Nitrospinaceae bacterium]